MGFLGAGIIWKQVKGDHHTVHGLTTAASLWLSAAVGIACAGELYFAASFSCALMMVLLRFGPRLLDDDADASTDAGDSHHTFSDLEIGGKYGSTTNGHGHDDLPNQLLDKGSVYVPLKTPRSPKKSHMSSRKSKASIRD